jgi:hypothetical protein
MVTSWAAAPVANDTASAKGKKCPRITVFPKLDDRAVTTAIFVQSDRRSNSAHCG